MQVKELVKWLSEFPDQEATVEVILHMQGSGYYDQGGNATCVVFDPEKHVNYTDFRGNTYAENSRWKNSRTLLLGEIDA